MKRSLFTLVSLCLIAAFALCFAACGKQPEVKPAADIDVTALAKSIYEKCKFEDVGLAEVPNPEFTVCTVFGADPELIAGEEGAKKAAAYVSSASPEMIVCIEAKDEASAQKLMDDTFKPLIETYIREYTNYTPAEVSKLESCVETVAGKYLVVAVTADNADAQSVIASLLG